MDSIPARLKALRQSIKPELSVRRMAEELGYGDNHNKYAYYEDEKRFKKEALPIHLAKEDDDRTPLQRLLTHVIAQSGKTRDNFDTQLRKVLETTGKPLWDIERGKVKRPSPKVLRAIEGVLGLAPESLVDLVHPRNVAVPAKASDHPPTRSASEGETAGVRRWDLSYAMGPGTNIDEDYLEGEEVLFDIGFLRSLTVSAPSLLRLVNGSGDSMMPTIHDREELILDLGQRRLNMQDRIWAISLYGAGALKRLRTIGQDKVLVISDNPDVPDQEVSAGDIHIVGRLVGSVKRH